MPGPAQTSLSGLTATKQIVHQTPQTRVVIVTMHDDPTIVRRLLEAGASGYVTKSVGRDELHLAITSALRENGPILVTVSRSTGNLAVQPVIPVPELTAREIKVLQALARSGGSNRVIAADLHITEATVKKHLSTINGKLGTTSRMQAALRAGELGLLTSESVV